MRTVPGVIVVCLVFAGAIAAQQPSPSAAPSTTEHLRVILLGTGGGPAPNPQRFGISTLVVAGTEMLMFDCGRAATIRMAQMGMLLGEVNKLFVTHLHSDHVIGIPDLYLTGWASQGRTVPLRVWGPAGTRDMMAHVKKAFAFDIHVRRDVDELFPAEGIRTVATDIREGVVYDENGVRVTAFLVDHGPVKPAFGYRVDYRGHSVVLSGDTRPSDNLVKFSQGVDLLIHEGGGPKKAETIQGRPDEKTRFSAGGVSNVVTNQQRWKVARHHTDGVEAGQIFARIRPRLVVFSHGGNSESLPLVRQHYDGTVEIGEDMMTIDVGDSVAVQRFAGERR
jgi:ribonuclease Z